MAWQVTLVSLLTMAAVTAKIKNRAVVGFLTLEGKGSNEIYETEGRSLWGFSLLLFNCKEVGYGGKAGRAWLRRRGLEDQ